MTTQQIIDELNEMTISNSEEYEQLERISELVTLLKQNPDGQLSCEALINLLERHPNIEFGTPGQPIHTIEKYEGYYEGLLLKSLDRKPTFMTIWMLNRIINVEKGEQKAKLVEKMKSYTTHPLADEEAKNSALDFYEYQIIS